MYQNKSFFNGWSIATDGSLIRWGILVDEEEPEKYERTELISNICQYGERDVANNNRVPRRCNVFLQKTIEKGYSLLHKKRSDNV